MEMQRGASAHAPAHAAPLAHAHARPAARPGRKTAVAQRAAEPQARSSRRKQRRSCAASAAQVEQPAAPAASQRPLRVMIAGAPAAGKGTQCAKIVEKHGLVHISAGDLLRAEVAAGTPAGLTAKRFMDEGSLVPNEVVVDMVVGRMAQPDVRSQGWLLDGYPRSAEQAEAIEAAGIHPDVFILINVPDEDLVARVVGRRLDPETGDIYHLTYKPPPADIAGRLVQRSDDTEDKLRNRLAGHHANVAAVVGYYTAELVEVDGSKPMAEVAQTIDTVLTTAQQRLAAQQ